MPSWSTRRQLLYLLIPLTVVLAVYAFVYSQYIYSPATCFDGVQNGRETGRDCGGTCSLLCTGDAVAPIVLWSRSFNVTGSVWNAVAYIQNTNTNSSAKNVSYTFRLLDENNTVIASRDGVTNIPPNKTFALFEGGIDVGNKIVKRTEFEFSKSFAWNIDTTVEPELLISNDPVINASTSPKIRGEVTNKTTKIVGPVELVALVFDGRQNVIGVSKTVVDPLGKGQSAPFIFTWPHPYPAGVDVCQVPSAVMLVLDRSGSMESQSKNPPEPLNSVKKTAIDFLSQLKYGDSAGVVSFATVASSPIDQPLSPNIQMSKDAVASIKISTSTTDQNTNIGDGIQKAVDALTSPDVDQSLKKVIVLLTDGIPTDPQNQGFVNYPTLYAEDIGSKARSQNITIYTIGLGKDINADILTNISGDSSRFFSAPDTNMLTTIYSKIESSICQRKPNVIEIISRIL